MSTCGKEWSRGRQFREKGVGFNARGQGEKGAWSGRCVFEALDLCILCPHLLFHEVQHLMTSWMLVLFGREEAEPELA